MPSCLAPPMVSSALRTRLLRHHQHLPAVVVHIEIGAQRPPALARGLVRASLHRVERGFMGGRDVHVPGFSAFLNPTSMTSTPLPCQQPTSSLARKPTVTR